MIALKPLILFLSAYLCIYIINIRLFSATNCIKKKLKFVNSTNSKELTLYFAFYDFNSPSYCNTNSEMDGRIFCSNASQLRQRCRLIILIKLEKKWLFLKIQRNHMECTRWETILPKLETNLIIITSYMYTNFLHSSTLYYIFKCIQYQLLCIIFSFFLMR